MIMIGVRRWNVGIRTNLELEVAAAEAKRRKLSRIPLVTTIIVVYRGLPGTTFFFNPFPDKSTLLLR